jgi:predicted metal-binding protein
MKNEGIFKKICDLTLELGAFRASVIPVSDVETDRSFRDLCAMNTCGNYGRCWMCPPDAGDIDVLIERLRSYSYILVYQSVNELEDSFDIEGMMAASVYHNELTQNVRKALTEKLNVNRKLFLCAGGCRVCEVCAKKTDEPCRHPDLAMASLETYGVNVSKLAAAAGMKYINGQNTVTYFSGVLFDI